MKHYPDPDQFVWRHIGPRPRDIEEMVASLGYSHLDALIADTVPEHIRTRHPLELPEPLTEAAMLERIRRIAAKNKPYRSFIGMGYYDTLTPPVIQRNIIENPGWYTSYTPYQPEISQGRLEALFLFQTVTAELTGMELANASLLDEATAAAEAMLMFHRLDKRRTRERFLVDRACHPQTIGVVQTRARALNLEVVVQDYRDFVFDEHVFGALVQYPTTDGEIRDYEALCKAAHEADALVAVASDLLALTLLKPPGEWGADAVVGSSQRFGVPMGYGGPHAAFFATREAFKRQVPGRLIGLSIDSRGKSAYRMALQTREQHIRRERATSNICTAQALLAVIAAMYAVYHGPEGLKRIARQVHRRTRALAEGLKEMGHELFYEHFFDTLRVRPVHVSTDVIRAAAEEARVNLRYYEDGSLGVSLDEATTLEDVDTLLRVFYGGRTPVVQAATLVDKVSPKIDATFRRTSPFLQEPVFNSYHSETEMMRYLHRLEVRDIALNTSMIPLGSCTMKLNAAAEMMPITWPEFTRVHPFVPLEQAEGYQQIIRELGDWLLEITGFHAISFQPNSGAQGEYTGLLVIRAYHEARGEGHRDVCLIPSSAHGTNPASATMAGLKVVIVACDERGDIDVEDLRKKAEAYSDRLAAIMITYPSTHGIFEEAISEIIDIVHQHGGQVYLDGANLNAQVGLCRPAEYGADVCHLNLHKTFAIPHGGGGPGMGPICVAEHLADFLPTHPVIPVGGKRGIGPVAAAPWGSPNILPISWAYIAMLGAEGLTLASKVAILNANYMAERLDPYFPVLYRGSKGRVGHEFILDLRPARQKTDVTEEDIAKRLMDFGFHAPTVSFPVPRTVMIEPTESESKAELDRYCEALMIIHREIEAIAEGRMSVEESPLRHAPHTADVVVQDTWERPYTRRQAAFPALWTETYKYWPPVGRINQAWGDRHLIVCACQSIEAYLEPEQR